MPKRKSTTAATSTSSDDDDASMLDVEFEFFDPQEHDYHGIKALLRQLVSPDGAQLDLAALTNLILSQPLLGTTVKCAASDDSPAIESDPYAFLTVLNASAHASDPGLSSLVAWLRARAASTPSSPSVSVLDQAVQLLSDPTKQVGLVLGERMVNMPAEIVPPMWAMLGEEMAWAVAEGEAFGFEHFVVLSRSYVEVASALVGDEDEEMQPRKKKRSKAGNGAQGGEEFLFHVEDEAIQSVAGRGTFEYATEEDGDSDRRRAFDDMGIRPRGSVMVFEGTRYAEVVEKMKLLFGTA